MKIRRNTFPMFFSGKKVSNNPNGFTLIELLVGIAVIAVLIGLAFSAFSKAKNSALSAKCVGNIRSMMVAYQTWNNDINRQLPRVNEPESKINYSTYLLPYLGGRELRCPLVSGDAELSSNYGFRYAINDGFRRYFSHRVYTEYPHRTVLAAEMYYMSEGFNSSTHLNNTMNGSSGRRPQQHGGGLNLGFLDGSVRNVQPIRNSSTGRGDWTLTPIYGTKAEGYFYNLTHFARIQNGTL